MTQVQKYFLKTQFSFLSKEDISAKTGDNFILAG
jgi:hypothetical protein